ncbi:hypothetical protein [Bifidobacterium sp.]|uniref:hypothetical protein n=1 Tax=Bifidobacterium sp. TaxID=41200 RepID=UPI003F7BF6FA
MIDLRNFYIKNIQEEDYHYRFYDDIKNVNISYDDFSSEYIENNDCKFEIFDAEDAVAKFKELCQPEVSFKKLEDRCWFYLVAYYLHKMGYVIKEFPSLLAKPPVDPDVFTRREIRNRLIELGDDDNGTVRYATRRIFVSRLTFILNPSHIEFDDSIDRKFIEISNRNASFNNMSTDEKLCEIANLIENMLKKGSCFTNLDYHLVCFEYITNKTVANYRYKMQCFRHATSEAVEERKSYSDAQKSFLVDYGITIVKVINELTNGAQAS